MSTPVYVSGSVNLPQGQEITVATIASLHAFYDAFIDARGIKQPTEWRIYAVVGAVTCLIATGNGPIDSISRVQWRVESDAPEGGGSSYILKAVNKGVQTVTVPYTFCGFDYTDYIAPNQSSGTVSANSSWQNICQLSGLFQNIDVDVTSASDSFFEIELLSRPGVGGVDTPIKLFSGKLGNGPTRIFEKVTLTPGDLWTVRVRTMDGSSGSITAGIAGYVSNPYSSAVSYPLLLPGNSVIYGGNSTAIQSPQNPLGQPLDIFWGGVNSAGNAKIISQDDVAGLYFGDDNAVSGWATVVQGYYTINQAPTYAENWHSYVRFRNYAQTLSTLLIDNDNQFIGAYKPVKLKFNDDAANYNALAGQLQFKDPGAYNVANALIDYQAGGAQYPIFYLDGSASHLSLGSNIWTYLNIRAANMTTYTNGAPLWSADGNNMYQYKPWYLAYAGNFAAYPTTGTGIRTSTAAALSLWWQGKNAGGDANIVSQNGTELYFGDYNATSGWNATHLAGYAVSIEGQGGLVHYSPNTHWYDWFGNHLFYHDADKLTTSRGRRKHITNVAVGAFPYTVLATDEVVYANPNAAAARTIFLDDSPNDGDTITIKLNSNFDAVSTCTIDGNGKNIDGAATLVLAAARKCAVLTFSDSAAEWMIVSIY